MIYTSENNWYSWKYGNDMPFGRQLTPEKKFTTHYGQYSGILGSFKDELENAARSTMDFYPSLRPCVFFSGGVDSELILRSYINIGSNPLVYIVRYEDDINLYDVSYAVTVCSVLGVDYKIVDFNLKKFYENDALQIARESQIDRPRMLPHLKFTESADGLIIVGHSDMAWYRPSDDYSVSVPWLCYDFEHDIGCDKYTIMHNRSAIYQWWKWTPGLILSYTRLNWFRTLINDGYYGKRGIDSTKIIGFREVYPDLIERKKKTGFEAIDPLINEFELTLLREHRGVLPYRGYTTRTIDQLETEILGPAG